MCLGNLRALMLLFSVTVLFSGVCSAQIKQVKDKSGQVNKNNKIDKNDEEIVTNGTVISLEDEKNPGNIIVTISTPVFIPPKGRKFGMLRAYPTRVDIASEPSATVATRVQDKDSAIEVFTVFSTLENAAYPSSFEGNLRNTSSKGLGGGGGGRGGRVKATDHWSAKLLNPEVKLKSVRFASKKGKNYFYEIEIDTESKNYRENEEDPHWEDNSTPLDGDATDEGDVRIPFAVRRTKEGDASRLSISARILAKDPNLENETKVLVRADGPDDIDLPKTDATYKDGYILLDETEIPVDLPDTIFYADHEKGTFIWEVLFDGGTTWKEAGRSKNQFYITWDKPLYEAHSFPLKHTFLHIGTTGGNTVGGKDPVKVIQAIFDEGGFKAKDISTIGGKSLVYYKNWVSGTCTTALQLVSTTRDNGICNAFADLFLKAYESQGIKFSKEVATISPNVNMKRTLPGTKISTHMLIENWDYGRRVLPERLKAFYDINATKCYGNVTWTVTV